MNLNELIKDKKSMTKAVAFVLLAAFIVFIIISSTALIAQNETQKETNESNKTNESLLNETDAANETNRTELPIVKPECSEDKDCDDNNELTIDLCIEGKCSYQKIEPKQNETNETNTTNFTLVIEDYDGDKIYSKLSIYDEQEKSWKKIDKEVEIKEGEHNVRIELTQTIKKIEIDSLEIAGSEEYKLRIDTEVPLEKSSREAVRIYAIDPTQLEFKEAIVTVEAKGNELWKCKEWDFDSRQCNGEWTYLMNIVPGEDYSFTLTPEDPAYAEYNFSGNYSGAGHRAWKSTNALAKPPAGGPSVPNEVELTAAEYTAISSSDNSRASAASANYRTFRFMFKLNESSDKIINLTIGWEGYTTGANAGQRVVDLYVWNFTSNSWSASLANNNLGSDYWLRYTFTTDISNIVNSTNHIIFLVETPDPPASQTFYTDMANVSVWYDLVPNTTLVSPPNGNVTTLNAANFTCNATDDVQLSNIIFYWNYTGSWQANGTVTVSGTSNQTTFVRTSLSNGAILWNCYACDNRSQCSFAPANWTVIVNYTVLDNPPTVTLSYPPDNYYNDTSQYVNLTFNATVTDDKNLVNCSLWHNYTGTWHLNQTQTVTGTSNVTNFSLNNLTNKTFVWNVQCYDNASQSAFAAANRTLKLNWTAPNTAPKITLNQPANNTQFNNTQNINFNFTVIDDLNITLNCSIYLDNVLNQTNNSVQNNTLTNFLINGISYGSHNWSVNCSDGELWNVSETRWFSINDTIAPGTITNLNATQKNTTWIYWAWTNPSDPDFSHVEIWLNGSWQTNTSNNYYNATGLTNDTSYTISIIP
ncbi:MAG: hypothetical protein N3G19_02075, partial [Candidatus Pacearchaeota archaeon]|nr:hypothetical protein [Candidatus Pacearchaeota archaeon]